MKQEQKELLLKDLCARLPYDVKVQIKNVNEICTLKEIDCSSDEMSVAVEHENGELCGYDFEHSKPYLFPLESMTLEQRIEYSKTLVIFDESHCSQTSETYDWFNKNKFDYRGLIPMGLANDATGLNIY